MAKKRSKETLGRLQAEVLRYVAENPDVSVAEVASHFASKSGKARTTILTVMEKLREKGYLTRRQRDGRFAYAPKRAANEVLNGIIKQFVDETLGGSVSPFVNYLSESGDLTGEELSELKNLVHRLESDRTKRRGNQQ
ncbi:MAG: BlaI/MecI/CopY family transcriptional regulator [Planctomycetota bacterium]